MSFFDAVRTVMHKKDSLPDVEGIYEEEAVSMEDEQEPPKKRRIKLPSVKFRPSSLLERFSSSRNKDKKPARRKESEDGNKHTKVHKGRIIALLVIGVIGMAGGFFYMNYLDNQEAAQRAERNAKPKVNASAVETDSYPDSFNVNPFVELNAVPGAVNGKVAVSPSIVPATPAVTSSTSSASYRVLPTIPSYTPRPDLPTFSPPARSPGGESTIIPAVPAESVAPAAPAAPASISGVMTGGNGNVAVMSDGSIVSEGETYDNKRIAYIGGDGIQFDDGSSIQYRP